MAKGKAATRREKTASLKRLGETIKSRRKQATLSQEALALKANLDRSYMGGVERGERNISWLNLTKISRALDMTVSQLVEGADP